MQLDSNALTSKTILRFFSPLAVSWLFMAVEAPICVGVLSHMASAKVNTAAFTVLIGLALWIESPVIDLLSTSTTLSRDKASYAAISKFSLSLMTLAMSVHALIACTPLYWFVTGTVLHIPAEVAQHARVGMIIMIPWSGFIGWRRYLQGILIRFGRTRLVGYGTGVRVLSICTISGILLLTTRLPGISIAACALVGAVGAEAAFAHVASRDVIRKHLQTPHPDLAPVDAKKLLSFHIPLSMTTVVTLSVPIMISSALSRSASPILALAAYQVAQTFTWMHRSPIYALPEVVITLYKDRQSAEALRKFCLFTGALLTGLLLLSAVSGFDRVFFSKLLGAAPDVTDMAHLAFVAASLTPFIGALQSYLRGMLTASHLTVARLYAIGAGVVVLVSGLALGVAVRFSGVLTAGFALTVSMLIELGVLTYFWRAGRTEAIGPEAIAV